VVVTAFVVFTEISERRHQEHVPTSGVLVLLCLAPALAIRRRLPGTALALVAAVQLGLLATRTAPGANIPAELIAPYSAAVYGSRRVRLAAGVVAGATLVTVALPGLPLRTGSRLDVLGFLVAGGAAWLLGMVMRSRRERVARVADRADRLERERDRQAQQAVAEERLRIARELHDVVAHNLSVVVVQAQALHPVLARDPEQARGIAVSIEEAGRAALEEMRRLLGVLRAGDDGTDDSALSAPQPGLDGLPALVLQVRQAGLPVTLTVRGEPEKLPPAVQLSGYRIVQEALTNVLKHAGPATAHVDVGYADAALVLSVTDDGRGAAAELGRPALPRLGHGLPGMRERVALFGGELSAGPCPGGGYEVQARIPVQTT
jgi:signal transduction histidine kinase